jgi:hypothetical protein
MVPVLVEVMGIRTKCWGDHAVNQVNVTLEVDEKGVRVVNGAVTGYESFCLKGPGPERENHRARMCAFGWCACSGTPNSWDKLEIPALECRKIWDCIPKEG